MYNYTRNVSTKFNKFRYSDRIKVLFSGDPSILSSGYQGMVSQITSELITAIQKLSQRSSPLRLQLFIIFMYKLSC